MKIEYSPKKFLLLLPFRATSGTGIERPVTYAELYNGA